MNTKFGDLEFPWSPHHETATSEIFEDPMMCATCHNELNPYDVWVKATFTEYEESVYPFQGVVCQTCHMQPMGGKPAKMGLVRPHNTDHWFGGGFTEFVEGAATVTIKLAETNFEPGQKVNFAVDVQAVATGHKFPTGSTEERDVWLRLSLVDKQGEELLHIPVPKIRMTRMINTLLPATMWWLIRRTANFRTPLPAKHYPRVTGCTTALFSTVKENLLLPNGYVSKKLKTA